MHQPAAPSRDDVGSPSQDGTGRCPLDQVLRRHGYTIHARPKQAEPLWELGGVVVSQSEALARLPEDEVAKARGR